MNIGILTFQHSINFGAQLQCFALQKFLESKGFNVMIINYIPDEKKGMKLYKGLGVRKYGILYALRVLFLRLLYVNKAKKKNKGFST
ncbi:hypothetical protein [Thermophagus xiamenensis]|uniref:Polysaccharide pyruvyl transferase n=1 Tax=Thermophagus xiamenensis TaxID=385682 RepID=A0A1I2DN13_9BACT|nr:hypothetical protein [Thermophagus xiamenensis]SFE81965.1 hypothetical protein SAMN05444380_11963 [Thermophagus xiamenensis]